MSEIMYNDLVNKVLPKIGEGISLTKDYATELAGRYVQYLIIVDSIKLICSLIGVAFFIWLMAYSHKQAMQYNSNNYMDTLWGAVVVCLACPSIILLTALSIDIIIDLIKIIIVPEVRIAEILMKNTK